MNVESERSRTIASHRVGEEEVEARGEEAAA
jgi:hypothetical protein